MTRAILALMLLAALAFAVAGVLAAARAIRAIPDRAPQGPHREDPMPKALRRVATLLLILLLLGLAGGWLGAP